jgi:hypothetical protein
MFIKLADGLLLIGTQLEFELFQSLGQFVPLLW